MNKSLKIAAAALAVAALPVAASAHPGLHAAGFADGFIHPFTGADHLLAMTPPAIGRRNSPAARASRFLRCLPV